jgi:tetratricopeptide (TPR) repeat protein
MKRAIVPGVAILACLAASSLLAGCPTTPADPLVALTLPPPPAVSGTAPEIADDDLEAHLFAFHAAAPADPRRTLEREALIRFYLDRAQQALAESDALDVRGTLHDVFSLFDPDELDGRPDSAALRKLLAWIDPVTRRLGRPEDSLAVAEARVLVDPADEDARRTTAEIADWAAGEEDEAEALERRAELYDAVTEILPAPGLVKQLVGLVLQRHDLGEEAVPIESLQDWFLAARRSQYYFSGLTLNIVRLAVRIGRPEAAADMLAGHRDSAAYLGDVLDEVAALADPPERPDAGSDLIDALAPQFPEEARRLCTMLRREFPDDGRFSACLGRYFAGRQSWGTAARFMLEAVSRDPETREFNEQALLLLGGEIQDGMDGTSWDALVGLQTAFDAALANFQTRWPTADLPVERTAVLRLLASAALIQGDVATARRLHGEALAADPSASAYLEFGQMEARAGDRERAVELLEAGLAVQSGDLADRTVARAGLHEELGRLHRDAGRADEATAAFDEAIDSWKQVARAGVVSQAHADVQVGRLGVLRGDREAGLRRIALAVRTAGEDEFGAQEDSAVYNQALSFLHIEGETALLTELFPLSATRQDLDVVWRVYHALWTLGASRRAERPDDPEVLAFLEAMRASGWSGILARFYRGELDFEAAFAAADTLGQQTELRYYEALNRLAAGDTATARTLLDQVVATNIFNYFEWEMARAQLDRLGRLPQPPAAASVSR